MIRFQSLLRTLLAGFFCVAAGALPAVAQEEPATRAELQEVRDALNGLGEFATEYRGYVDALRKIKISGYVQPQFRYTDLVNTPYTIGTYNGGAFPTWSKSQFQVRRGRVKVTYDNVVTQFVLQIDATQLGGGIPGGVTVKDAYAMVLDPWTKNLGLQMGIFDRPFGYEISYSSSLRESPERSRMYQTLFPGERELGAKVFFAPQSGPLTFLRADVGLFNGSGPVANEFDNYKDIIGHLAVQLPLENSSIAIDLGASGYFGKVRSQSSTVYSMGTTSAGVTGWVARGDTLNFGAGLDRQYLGADIQLYYDLPILGGLILRGEYIAGDQPGTSSSSNSLSAIPASSLYKRPFAGWYITYVQNLGSNDQLVLKYDVFDPNTDVKASDFVSGSGLTVGDIKYSTLGLGAIHHLDENVKFVLYWEVIRNEELTSAPAGSLAVYKEDVRDNVLTFRMQYKF